MLQLVKFRDTADVHKVTESRLVESHGSVRDFQGLTHAIQEGRIAKQICAIIFRPSKSKCLE